MENLNQQLNLISEQEIEQMNNLIERIESGQITQQQIIRELQNRRNRLSIINELTN